MSEDSSAKVSSDELSAASFEERHRERKDVGAARFRHSLMNARRQFGRVTAAKWRVVADIVAVCYESVLRCD